MTAEAIANGPRVLMITGAYSPEFSAGGLQCQAVSRALDGRARVQVLTTATRAALPRREVVEGVEVSRVYRDGRGGWSSVASFIRMLASLVRLVPRVGVVHIQGVSAKNTLAVGMSKLFGRPVIVHLQTARHDEPPAIRRQGRLAWWAFRAVDRYISVSPGLAAAAIGGGIRGDKIVVVPNGVDTSRFAPSSADERRQLRARLGLPIDLPMILFVGVMAPDKQPHVLLDAWASLQQGGMAAALVFVGATNPLLYELGDRLIDSLRATVARLGLEERVRFVAPTAAVDQYFRAADVLAMPSLREGCPNVLLEAMACGLPAVASRLPGSTDAIIEDGVNGLLVEVGNTGGFARAIDAVLRDGTAAERMGAAARQTMLDRFTMPFVATQWLEVYRDVLQHS